MNYRHISGHTSSMSEYEFTIRKTPPEWWRDYLKTHPDYDPRNLTFEEGEGIYGHQFHLFKENNEKYKDIDDDEEEEYFRRLFMDNHFGESYKYILLPGRRTLKAIERDKKIDELIHNPKLTSLDELANLWSREYDPMVENPEAYLHFCRLSRLIDMGWNAGKVIKEVLKFVNKYGPPWYVGYLNAYTPPWDDPPYNPLTVDSILFASQQMAWAVEAYKLLSELDEDFRASNLLKKHMVKVVNKRHYIGGEIPQLTNEIQITQAATDFVEESVNGGLEKTDIKVGLESRMEKGSAKVILAPKYTFNSLLGAMWLQFYFEILDNGRLRECANENCRRFFLASRSNKEYCSKECGVKQYMRKHPRNHR